MDDDYLGRPRTRVSRRGSRYSSFGHSHSDSLELQESVCGRRDPSLELSDARGGSFSSEDSTPIHPKQQRASSLDIRIVETAPYSHPASPRTERKISPQSLYPNTLTVDIPNIPPTTEEEVRARSRSPAPSVGARSASRSGSPCSPLRGISYPPLSPKVLKVGFEKKLYAFHIKNDLSPSHTIICVIFSILSSNDFKKKGYEPF